MEGPEVVVLDDEEEVIDLTGAADGSLLAELLSAYDAANSPAVKEEKGSHAAASSEPLHEVISAHPEFCAVGVRRLQGAPTQEELGGLLPARRRGRDTVSNFYRML